MNDASVRKALRHELRKNTCTQDSALVVEEVGVLHGLGRIDMLIMDTLLHGIEIKSESDTLQRLKDQIPLFSAVLDRVSLFVAFKHADKALRLVPPWWGVYLLSTGKTGTLEIYPAREAEPNPSPNCKALAKLLWKSEALALLESIDAATGVRTKNRTEIYSRVATVMTHERIRSYVIKCLMKRMSKRSVLEQKSGDD